MNNTTKTEPTCRYCGSTNVTLDGTATWNTEAQEWELAHTYDTGYCLDCESESKYFDWKEPTA